MSWSYSVDISSTRRELRQQWAHGELPKKVCRRKEAYVQPDLSTLQPSQSPLFMALDDPVLHKFISYLTQKKDEQESKPTVRVEIELTRSFIDSVRESFKQTIVDGERHLHSLAHLLASWLLEGDFELHSNVIGVLPDDQDRPFLIRERISQETLFGHGHRLRQPDAAQLPLSAR